MDVNNSNKITVALAFVLLVVLFAVCAGSNQQTNAEADNITTLVRSFRYTNSDSSSQVRPERDVIIDADAGTVTGDGDNDPKRLYGLPFYTTRVDGVTRFELLGPFVLPGDHFRCVGTYASMLYVHGDLRVAMGAIFDVSAEADAPGPGGGIPATAPKARTGGAGGLGGSSSPGGEGGSGGSEHQGGKLGFPGRAGRNGELGEPGECGADPNIATDGRYSLNNPRGNGLAGKPGQKGTPGKPQGNPGVGGRGATLHQYNGSPGTDAAGSGGDALPDATQGGPGGGGQNNIGKPCLSGGGGGGNGGSGGPGGGAAGGPSGGGGGGGHGAQGGCKDGAHYCHGRCAAGGASSGTGGSGGPGGCGGHGGTAGFGGGAFGLRCSGHMHIEHGVFFARGSAGKPGGQPSPGMPGAEGQSGKPGNPGRPENAQQWESGNGGSSGRGTRGGHGAAGAPGGPGGGGAGGTIMLYASVISGRISVDLSGGLGGDSENPELNQGGAGRLVICTNARHELLDVEAIHTQIQHFPGAADENHHVGRATPTIVGMAKGARPYGLLQWKGVPSSEGGMISDALWAEFSDDAVAAIVRVKHLPIEPFEYPGFDAVVFVNLATSSLLVPCLDVTSSGEMAGQGIHSAADIRFLGFRDSRARGEVLKRLKPARAYVILVPSDAMLVTGSFGLSPNNHVSFSHDLEQGQVLEILSSGQTQVLEVSVPLQRPAKLARLIEYLARKASIHDVDIEDNILEASLAWLVRQRDKMVVTPNLN